MRSRLGGEGAVDRLRSWVAQRATVVRISTDVGQSVVIGSHPSIVGAGLTALTWPDQIPTDGYIGRRELEHLQADGFIPPIVLPALAPNLTLRILDHPEWIPRDPLDGHLVAPVVAGLDLFESAPPDREPQAHALVQEALDAWRESSPNERDQPH